MLTGYKPHTHTYVYDVSDDISMDMAQKRAHPLFGENSKIFICPHTYVRTYKYVSSKMLLTHWGKDFNPLLFVQRCKNLFMQKY